MILFKRTLPILTGLVAFLGLFLISWWQDHIWILLALTVLAVILGLGVLAGWGADLERWGVIAISPTLFVVAAVAFMLFVQETWLLIMISAVTAVFIALFLEHVFRFIFAPGLYQPYALEHTSIVLHIASVYFFTTMFYGLNTFCTYRFGCSPLSFCVGHSVRLRNTLGEQNSRSHRREHGAPWRVDARSTVRGDLLLPTSFLSTRRSCPSCSMCFSVSCALVCFSVCLKK